MASSSAATAVPVREDGGFRSLCTNERDFLRACALGESNTASGDGGVVDGQRRRVLRGDGRGPGQVRNVKITLGRSHNEAQCSVQWGTTRASSLITGILLPPSLERPSDGAVSISVDLSPMACTGFLQAQPVTTTPGLASTGDLASVSDESQKLLTNRIVRSLERTLLIGGALDTEALCVQSGAWVWRLHVSVTVLDHGGNLLDAAVLAAVASLRHYRKPQVDVSSSSEEHQKRPCPKLIHSDLREPTPLPLHHTPLSISFALIHADQHEMGSSGNSSEVAALVDPTDREELVQTGSISLSMNVHSEVCLVDFAGGCELVPSQLKQCWRLAETNILQLCEMLETTLQQADTKAHEERLHRLQQTEQRQVVAADNVPFAQDSSGQDFMEIDTSSDWKNVMEDIETAAAQVNNEEEEAYRRQALDYALGHVAAKVKDTAGKSRGVAATAGGTANNNKPGSLLAAMVQSAQSFTNASDVMEAKDAGGTKEAVGSNQTMDLRSSDAQDEFEQFAKHASRSKKSSAFKQSQPVAVDSDEEEETTTMLQSEFQSVLSKPASTTTAKSAVAAAPTMDDDDDNIDDLAMAIKKKKKKSKKSK